MTSERFFCRVPADWWADPSQCWFEWQTFIAGILALAAAGVSVLILRKQISQTEELHRSELKRRHDGVRVIIPMALAEISQFLDSIAAEVVVKIKHRQTDNEEPDQDAAGIENRAKNEFPSLKLPAHVISVLRDFVETISDAKNVRHVAELVSSLQILEARFNGFNLRQIGVLDSLYGLMIDTAKVKTLNDALYNYGRFVDEGEFSLVGDKSHAEIWDLIHGKAQGFVFYEPIPDVFFPKLGALIKSFKDHQTSPWNERFE